MRSLHKQTLQEEGHLKTVWFLFLFVQEHLITVLFLPMFFSYRKNTLEKVICKQDHEREAFQHGLIMRMSFTDILPSTNTGQTPE